MELIYLLFSLSTVVRSQLSVAFELCAAMCAHNCDTRQSCRLVTFEILFAILTIENLNSWQSLLPDNWQWTAFAILTMFVCVCWQKLSWAINYVGLAWQRVLYLVPASDKTGSLPDFFWEWWGRGTWPVSDSLSNWGQSLILDCSWRFYESHERIEIGKSSIVRAAILSEFNRGGRGEHED